MGADGGNMGINGVSGSIEDSKQEESCVDVLIRYKKRQESHCRTFNRYPKYQESPNNMSDGIRKYL